MKHTHLYCLISWSFLIMCLFNSCQNSEEADVSNIKVAVNMQRFDESMMKLKNKDEIKAFLQKNSDFDKID